MLTSNKLFWHRVKLYFIKQWYTIRLVVDWTVVLYIGIPFLIFLAVNHYQWWQNAPHWISFFNFPAFSYLLFLIVVNGQPQFFYDYADVVFLINNTEWVNKLKVYGMYFSLISDGLLIALYMLFLSPLFLIAFNLSWTQIGLLGIVLLLVKQIIGYIYHILNFWLSGLFLSATFWILKLVIFALISYSLTQVSTLGIVLLLFVASILWLALLVYRYNVKGKLLLDIQREDIYSNRLRSLLVVNMGTNNKRQVFSMKRPLLFRKSQQLYRGMSPVKGLSELILKNKLRDGRFLMFYLQMSIYSCVAIMLFPLILKYIIFFGVTFLLAFWIKENIGGSLDHGFIQLFNVNEGDKLEALKITHSHLLWGGLIIQMAGLTLSLYGWSGFLIGCPLLYLYQKVLVTSFLLLK